LPDAAYQARQDCLEINVERLSWPKYEAEGVNFLDFPNKLWKYEPSSFLSSEQLRKPPQGSEHETGGELSLKPEFISQDKYKNLV
jgi:hypothetical protein